MLTRVRGELRKLLVSSINAECGVSSAQDILEKLKIQIGLCLGEMKQEKEDLVKNKITLKVNLEAVVNDLKNAGVFTKKEPLAADVAEAARQYNICLIDIQRHEAAITFYNSILVNFNESEAKVKVISDALKAVKSNLSQRIALLQKGVDEDETIFQINLASEDAKRVIVKPEDIIGKYQANNS